jgi:hypothetical protein
MAKKRDTSHETQAPPETPSPLTGEGWGEGEPDTSHETPATVHVANVDHDGVYWGVIEKHRDDVTAEDFEVPKECDLKPGRYKLNRDPKRVGGPGFDPLERSKQKSAPTSPTFEEALYALIRGNKAKAEAWAEHYEKTLDAKKK